MKRRTKTVVPQCLIVTTFTGTGAVCDDIPITMAYRTRFLLCTVEAKHQHRKRRMKARASPYDAEDDYICWEIVSGKSYVRFEDSDRSGDDMDFVAVKPGTAKIRCYVYGKNKDRYGNFSSRYL